MVVVEVKLGEMERRVLLAVGEVGGRLRDGTGLPLPCGEAGAESGEEGRSKGVPVRRPDGCLLSIVDCVFLSSNRILRN